MRRLLLLTLILLLPLAAIGNSPHGVVLMYHRFDEERYPSTNITLEQFEAQLDYLQQEGFTIWPLRRFLSAILTNEEVPDRSVALTVDDAYLSVYEKAFPIAKQRKVPLTVFVSTDAVDHHLGGYMSWAQMREMAAHGIDFANHGASHDHLTEWREGEDEAGWAARVTQDIEGAQQRLDKELGAQRPLLFAYPYGEFDCALAKLVRKLGYLGLGQHSGAIGPLTPRDALPRFPINEHYAPLEQFADKVASLPLPVAEQHPRDTQIGENNPPTLELKIAPDEGPPVEAIRCYLGNGRPLQVEVVDKWSVRLSAQTPLRRGRSRYNCTAPAGKGRFYWFSQPWLNGPDASDPGR